VGQPIGMANIEHGCYFATKMLGLARWIGSKDGALGGETLLALQMGI